MTEIIATGSFIVGVHLTIILFAAGYAFIDHAYCLVDHWKRLLLRLIVIVGITAAIYAFTPTAVRQAFMYGQFFFAIFHVLIFFVGKAYISYPRNSGQGVIHVTTPEP